MGDELRAKPRQERSERTIARLVDAAERVLDRVGREGATTTTIAAEAGVSVGRLYYWFPDLDALVATAANRATSTLRARLDDIRRTVPGQSFGHAIEQLVGVVADLVWSHPGMAELLAGLPPTAAAPAGGSMSGVLRSFVNDLVSAYVPGVPPEERDVVATVAAETVVAGTAAMLTAPPARAERLEHEVVYALVAYLSSRYPAAGDLSWFDDDRPARPSRPAIRGAWRHGALSPGMPATR